MIHRVRRSFVDSIRISVRGGTGGHGLPKYGGIGGKGGDVYVQSSDRVVGLSKITALTKGGIIKAGDGRPAVRTQLLGQSGQDHIIRVPVGVTIVDSDEQHLGDLNKPGEKVLVAIGGQGGDKYNDAIGSQGQKRLLKMDLKLISDAVFIGFPNAGKSSLLNAISNATPKVADYPFTTLRPYKGIVKYSDFRAITFADLPGLVEGAHKNLGLGHEFLKHIVRSRLLLFMIDVNGTDLGPNYPKKSPLETMLVLNREIELYDDTLLKKPAIVAVSKMDSCDDSREKFEEFKEQILTLRNERKLIHFDDVIPISSKTRRNLEELKTLVRDVIDKYAEQEKALVSDEETRSIN